MDTRRWQSTVFSILITGICLLAGSYSAYYTHEWDLTSHQRHTLSTTSTAVLALLDAPVEVVAVVGPDQTQRNAVRTLFARYQSNKPDMTLRFLNPETQPLQVETLGANPDGEVILRYADREQRLQRLSERSLTEALQRLARPGPRHVRFVQGHHERDPAGPGRRDFATITQRMAAIGLDVTTISLVTQPSIPEDTDLLVIASPRSRYFPGEVASLLSYLGQGGNLLWLREPQAPDTGLRALEIELGVSALPGIVVDAKTQAFNVDSPTFAVIDTYPRNPLTDAFTGITLFPQAAGLSVLPMQDHTIRPLLLSSDQSWTETGPIEGQVTYDAGTQETQGPVVFGVTVERERDNGKQRIAVIGDADFLANAWLGNGANQAFAERLFNWLSQDDAMLDFEAPRAPDSQIDISQRALIAFAVVFLVVLPLTLFIIAGGVWRQQRRG